MRHLPSAPHSGAISMIARATVCRFNKEFSGTDGNTSFDMQNLQVRSCLVSNGYNVGYATDDTEQLW